MSDERVSKPVERVRPTEVGSERDTLEQLLDFLRATAVKKAAGLTDEQAFARPVPASDLSVAGLIKHLTGVERFWFSVDFAALDVPWPWTDQDPHGGFPIDADDSLSQIVDDYMAECERSRHAVADSELEAMARSPGMNFTLRYALVHLVEETARHCGHLDLLRESIDGEVGE